MTLEEMIETGAVEVVSVTVTCLDPGNCDVCDHDAMADDAELSRIESSACDR